MVPTPDPVWHASDNSAAIFNPNPQGHSDIRSADHRASVLALSDRELALSDGHPNTAGNTHAHMVAPAAGHRDQYAALQPHKNLLSVTVLDLYLYAPSDYDAHE